MGLFVASFCGLALLASVTGCPGTLENPEKFPPPVSGVAGTMGGAGSGAAGTTGAAGSGVTGDCDAMPIFVNRSCSIDGACHGAMPAAGFDMKTAGWETMLVGKMPPGGGSGATASKCMAAGMPYLVKGSNPATGLFIDKLTKAIPTCGAAMPNIGDPLNATEKDCLIKWATKLTTK